MPCTVSHVGGCDACFDRDGALPDLHSARRVQFVRKHIMHSVGLQELAREGLDHIGGKVIAILGPISTVA